MRSSYFLFVTLLMLSFSFPAFAQDEGAQMSLEMIKNISKTPNLGVGVKTERSLRGAIDNFNRLKRNHVEMENFEIVIAGKVLKEISENKALYQLIESQLKDENFKISACAVALKHLDLTAKDLPKGIEITPTYSLRIYELQALGYNFIN